MHAVDEEEIFDHVPAMHKTHDAAEVTPSIAEYVPALHAMHCTEPVAATAEDQVPALQVKHAAIEVADIDVDHVPATHCEHKGDPAAEDHVPALQERQTTDTVAPTELDHVPTLHLVHDAASDMEEYVPAGQIMHLSTLSMRYWPGGQVTCPEPLRSPAAEAKSIMRDESRANIVARKKTYCNILGNVELLPCVAFDCCHIRKSR